MSVRLRAYSVGCGMYYAAFNSIEAERLFRKDNEVGEDWDIKVGLVPYELMDATWVDEDGEPVGSIRSMLGRMKGPGLIVESA